MLTTMLNRSFANTAQRDVPCRRLARHRWLIAALGAAFTTQLSGTAQAAVVWRGDFEPGDFSQWSYELNPEGLSVVSDPVADGTNALRVELTAETVWSNGIFRTELQHLPDASRASEGAQLFFGWSVFLPAPLPTGDEQDYQLGYFETTATYNQVLSLHSIGDGLILSLNHEAVDSGWIDAGPTFEPEQWHRIVYQVKWSANNAVGFVSLWVDGVKRVDEAHGQTFVDGNPAFVQLGLLKNPPAPPGPVLLYVDAALEGDSYEDVSLGIPEGGVTQQPVVPPDAGTTDTGTPTEPGSTTSTTTSAPAVTSTEATSTDVTSTDVTSTDATPTGATATTTSEPVASAPATASPSVTAPATTPAASTGAAPSGATAAPSAATTATSAPPAPTDGTATTPAPAPTASDLGMEVTATSDTSADSGCACRVAGTEPAVDRARHGASGLLLLLGLAWRRRIQRHRG